ncbi:MAG: hypothetical protein QG628_164, partial [Patescibacteria group bacterium]|nr:hypothetical protein [Patescibacteria group bacterium]
MRRAKPVMFIIRQHEIIPYPEETDPVVQIGSRVGVIIDDNPAFKIDIVGYRDSDADDAEIDQVHHEALLAAALLGKVSGEATVTVIGDFEKSISIASVDQTSVREAYVQVLTEEVPLI